MINGMMKNNLMRNPRLVIPKGRLYEPIKELFKRSEYNLPEVTKGCKYFYENYFEGCDLFIAKPKSIPHLLKSGFAEFCFCGWDIMVNEGGDSSCNVLMPTNIGWVKMVLASKFRDFDINKINPRRPLIVATEFSTIASEYFTSKGIPHYILPTSGSTEGYIDLEADCIIDIVETGGTLLENGLYINEIILDSEVYLYSSDSFSKRNYPEIIKTLLKNENKDRN